MKQYEQLKIENQVCFPLYAAAKEVIRQYTPFLAPLELTYTQYITMMILWEEKEISVKELGNRLYLNSGTLTPLLKRLEKKNYIMRRKSLEDERSTLISVTEQGMALREKAASVPEALRCEITLTDKELLQLYRLLYKLLKQE